MPAPSRVFLGFFVGFLLLCQAFFSPSTVFAGPSPAQDEPARTDFLRGRFQWVSSPPLVAPVHRSEDPCVSVKDPSVVFDGGQWHLFCTIRSQKRTHQIEYTRFADWSQAGQASRHILAITSNDFCAPQVFYFRPHRKWYLIYQASHTYGLAGFDRYLTVVEAQAGNRRYYKAYLADRHDGEWTPLAATLDNPFAGVANVEFGSGAPWTQSFSHGELLRAGHDERLEVDPRRLRFFYQGVSDADKAGKNYGAIPWRLGLLEPKPATTDASARSNAEPWTEIIGTPAQGAWASPQANVVWREDLSEALREAQLTGRPMFVTLRCLPCKQCADFDQAVLEGGVLLDPFLKQFITVRLTNAEALDLRVFPAEGYQDFDLSWWGYFLSDQGERYGIFGGKDEGPASRRLSVKGLSTTLQRVLDHHFDPRRKGWRVDGPVPDLAKPARNARDFEGWTSWAATRPAEESNCLHCHQIVEILRQPAIDANQFDKHRELDMWPLPENVGLSVDRDDGLRVTAVVPGSAADRAGIRPGDDLAAAEGHRLFGQADLRGVLHRGPRGAGTIRVWWLRQGRAMSGLLPLEAGWRRTILDWRMSVSQGNIGAGPGFFPIQGPEREGRITAKPYFGNNQSTSAYRAGVRPHHVILAVNGQIPPGPGRAFLVWFRQLYEAGDEVTLTVDDMGRRQEITYRLEKRNH